MNALIIILIAIAVLVLGYIFYGGWLAKQWGVDARNATPAHTMEDGVDYVPAKPYVVLGHHFSSIAGAGPINGPIQAAIFGWVPVMLWVLIGGIFFGAMHDFGALFASIRNKGKTLAEVVAKNIDYSAKKLFCIFAWLTLILVVAAFASIVAGTFADPDGTNIANARTATISVLFIVAALIWGSVTRGKNMPTWLNILSAILTIIVIVAVGYLFPFLHGISSTTWMILLGLYILAASVAPVWVLLQPRDYLSSYLLYGMIALALIAIVGATIATGTKFDIPAFTAFDTTSLFTDAKVFGGRGLLFPALFITIACGAISGFHSLVASGTTSKQVDKESEAQPIAYGGMLLECLLAIISLCAVAYVWNAVTSGDYATPTQVFAGGLSAMMAQIPGLAGIAGEAGSLVYSLLILAVSAFCLTSLDTATRIGRMMFQEMFSSPKTQEGDEEKETGWRAILTNPYVATVITVIFGVVLGMTGYAVIWPLFGAANQLLAALALLAVCSFLGNMGRNNKMFYFPMIFMLIVTLTSLILTSVAKVKALAAGFAFAPFIQLVLAVALFVLAIILAIKACKHIFGMAKKNA